MAHAITVSADGKYIILTVTGQIDRRVAMSHNLEAHALGKKLGIHRYLVDLRESTNTDTVFQNYEFAYDDMASTPGIDRSARVAMLVAPGDHSHDFVETVSRNAGLDVTLYTDPELAQRHLHQE